MRRIFLVVHNVRSAHNVGSIMRSADGFGVTKLYLTGYSPYPLLKNDSRLPHEAKKIDNRIKKTALGAEKTLDWSFEPDANKLISDLKKSNVLIAALEQHPGAQELPKFRSNKDIALILGNELSGIDEDMLKAADIKLQIPMKGSKESFNVAACAAAALYHLSYVA